MAENIDPTRSTRPASGLSQEETLQRRQSAKTKANAEDRVSLGEQEEVKETYGPGLKVASPYELLRNLVVKTLQEQGLELRFSTGDTEVDFNSMTQEEAQALIAEDGYFGVEKTSQRIVDFAINGFGNDPTKLQEMKDAIDQGFQEAQEAFGGALPEISQQTYEAIMEKLDAFAAQFEESGE
ncbi:hypothetical protein [uncultured Desulfuromusa sp.]|uniref:hypothetical protein n=1 Tax=uncultured Desulfuromusa sp. TaxID=219183 RepID=UPI002AA6D480|nr:hypothetical protein [uncultured Desulfuromusa sp.]